MCRQCCAGGKVKASSITPAGESKTQGEGDDDEFSPVGMTEADLQGEGLQLQDQDWSLHHQQLLQKF